MRRFSILIQISINWRKVVAKHSLKVGSRGQPSRATLRFKLAGGAGEPGRLIIGLAI